MLTPGRTISDDYNNRYYPNFTFIVQDNRNNINSLFEALATKKYRILDDPSLYVIIYKNMTTLPISWSRAYETFKPSFTYIL